MTREEIYEIWNSPESPWSAWTKPVLFSYLKEEDSLDRPTLKRWDVPSTKGTAVIADVPGADGLAIGLALCLSAGFRPIPVYNACPFAAYSLAPILSIVADPSQPWISLPTAVDYAPTLYSLAATSERFAQAKLPATAPPAFLIEGNREGRGRITTSEHGRFDNRSLVSASDFPSGQLLNEHGLSMMILIQSNEKVQWDLLEVLLSWQSEGIRIARQKPWEPWSPQLVVLKRPSALVRLWHQLTSIGGVRESPFGPYGEYVPPSSG